MAPIAIAQQSTPIPEGGKFWKPANSSSKYSDPFAACDAHFNAILANVGLTPNGYIYTPNSRGHNNSVSCAEYDGIGFSNGTTGHAVLVCPSGTAPSGDGNYCTKPQNEGDQCAGNPIQILDGAKRETDTDFIIGRGRLHFTRSYSSTDLGAYSTALGKGWSSDFHPLVRGAFDGVRGLFYYQLPGGRMVRFQKHNGVWRMAGLPWGGAGGWQTKENHDRKDLKGYQIEELTDYTIILTTPDNVKRYFTFDPPPSYGKTKFNQLTKIEYPDGYEVNFTYSSTVNIGTNLELVETVTDTDGYSIDFTYTDHQGLLDTVTAPDGSVYKYEYEDLTNSRFSTTGQSWRYHAVLEKVIYPDSTASNDTDNPYKTYHYADRIFFNGPRGTMYLAGITDERGIKTKEWEYGYYGQNVGVRANASRGADGNEEFLIEQVTARQQYRVTNPKGKEALFNYVDKGKVLRLASVEGIASSNCAASNTSSSYDNYGNQTVRVDAEGQRVESSFDSSNALPTQVKYAAGTSDEQFISTTWDTAIRKPTSIVEPGLSFALSYDANQNLTTKTVTDTTSHSASYSTNGQSRTYTYTWNSNGLLQSVDGPLLGSGDTVSYTYDAKGNVASITNEVGLTTVINAVDGMGRPTQITDPNGHTIALSYTPRGWVSSMTETASGGTRQTSFSYDAAGNITQITNPDSSSISYSYNNSGWLTSATLNTGDTLQYSHDTLGNPTSVTIGGGAASLSMTYDDLGRLTQLLAGAGDTTSFGYDRSNRRTTVLDGTGRTWLTAFDALNRVITETDPESHSVQLDWTKTNALSAHTDARNLTTSFVRNGFGEVIREISPDKGVTDYWRDTAGRVTRMLDAAGNDVSYTYDDAGRLLGETYPLQPALNAAYTYDSTSGGNQGLGRLTQASNSVSSHLFTYNGFGDVTSHTQTVEFDIYATSYNIASNGQLTSMTLPRGREVAYSYDAAGRLSGITTKANSSAPSQTVVSSITRAPYGPITSYDLGNGTSASFGLDASYRLSSITLDDGSSTLLSKSYQYDGASRITAIYDGYDTAASATYDYSSDGRLESADGPWGIYDWTFDPVGNRLSEDLYVSGTQVRDHSYSYASGSNRLSAVNDNLSSTSRLISYTADGDISQDIGTSARGYSYGQDGRLERVDIGGNLNATYAYDAFEHRVKRTAAGTETHFVFSPAGQLLGEYDGQTGAVVKEYIWLEGRLVATVDAAGALNYVQTGHLGQPLLVMDGSGAELWRGESTPFGTYVYTSGSGSAPDLRFPGQWLEAGSGLFHNWHRDYDPSLGRYIEADPLGVHAGQSVYGYVNSDPLNRIDPQGLVGSRGGAVFLTYASTKIAAAMNKALCEHENGISDPSASPWRKAIGAGGRAGFDAAIEWYMPGPPLPGMRGFGKGKGPDSNGPEANGPWGPRANPNGPKGPNKGPNSHCCFVAGTLVDTEDGLRPIEEVEVGDRVWARDEVTGETTLKPVTDVISRHERLIWNVLLSGAEGEPEKFETTDDHPWWVAGQGWKTTEELTPGMSVSTRDGRGMLVLSVTETDSTEPTFNLTVADFETYFVGEQSVLVHNCKYVPVDTKWRIIRDRNIPSYVRGYMQQQLNKGVPMSRVKLPPGRDWGHWPPMAGQPHGSHTRIEFSRDNRSRGARRNPQTSRGGKWQ